MSNLKKLIKDKNYLSKKLSKATKEIRELRKVFNIALEEINRLKRKHNFQVIPIVEINPDEIYKGYDFIFSDKREMKQRYFRKEIEK